MKTWLKNNYFIALFLFASISFTIIFSFSHAFSSEEEQVITIEHGDNLWSLANKYATTQSTSEWIDKVIELNQLQTSTIKAGYDLRIPSINDEHNYILTNETEIAGSEQ